MRYFEKNAKKKKDSSSTVKVLGAAVATGGLGASGIAGSRLYHQLQADPSLVHVIGGSPDYWRNKKFTNVFETQRKALSEEINRAGYKSNEYSSMSKNFRPGKHPIRTPNYGIPTLEIDVGNRMFGPITTRLKRLLKGNVHYRMFSDIGPSNQNQPISDGPVPFNTMRAPKGKRYDRNIVPGGDVSPASPAVKENINVESIPKEHSDVFFRKPVNKKTRVTVSFGSGHNWRSLTFPEPAKKFNTIINSLNKVHGKDSYTLDILGGPNTSPEYVKYFSKLEKENPGKIKYVPTLKDSKETAKFIHGSDLHIFGAGSTAAEIAGARGYKPKLLSMIPEGDFSQFEYNTDWMKNKLKRGVASVNLEKMTEDSLVNTLTKLKSGKNPISKTIRFGKADVDKIIQTAAKDFLEKKKFTGKLGLAGLAALAVGGTLLAVDTK